MANHLTNKTVALPWGEGWGEGPFVHKSRQAYSLMRLALTPTPYATLTGAHAVDDARALNVAQIILHGARQKTRVFMPACGHAYSDEEIAATKSSVTT